MKMTAKDKIRRIVTIATVSCALHCVTYQGIAFAASSKDTTRDGGYVLIATRSVTGTNFAISQRFSTYSSCEAAKNWWLSEHSNSKAECFPE